MLAMTRPLHELVKPGLEHKWQTEIFPKYFVRDATCIDQCRKPGLFKEEAVITFGSMVALRNVILDCNIKYISLL